RAPSTAGPRAGVTPPEAATARVATVVAAAAVTAPDATGAPGRCSRQPARTAVTRLASRSARPAASPSTAPIVSGRCGANTPLGTWVQRGPARTRAHNDDPG